jgi:hypothetical protein
MCLPIIIILRCQDLVRHPGDAPVGADGQGRGLRGDHTLPLQALLFSGGFRTVPRSALLYLSYTRLAWPLINQCKQTTRSLQGYWRKHGSVPASTTRRL